MNYYKIILTPDAESDLTELRDYIAYPKISLYIIVLMLMLDMYISLMLSMKNVINYKC